MTHVPDEIWEQVFSNFEDHMPIEEDWWMGGSRLRHEDLSTLHSLCLVSHQFQRVAQPLLYRTIPMEGCSAEKLVQARFLRTLSEHPQLGQHVRNVSFDDDAEGAYLRYRAIEHPVLYNILRAGLDYISLPPPAMRRIKKSLLEQQSGGGLGALFMAYMPQSQLVDCTVHRDDTPSLLMLSGCLGLEEDILGDLEGRDKEDPDDTRTHDQKGNSLPKDMFTAYTFPHLTEVRIGTADYEGVTSFSTIQPIFRHPTLKRLRALGIDLLEKDKKPLIWPTEGSNLQYLDLKESIIDAAGMRGILTRCPRLKGLSMEMAPHHRESDQHVEDWEVDLEEFGNVLRQFGQNLEDFAIDTNNYNNYHSTEGRLGSLQTLISLKHLNTGRDELLGPIRGLYEESETPALQFDQALPPFLETLFLYHCGYGYEARNRAANEELREFITNCAISNLREIQLELNHNETEEEWHLDSKVCGWGASFRKEYFQDIPESSEGTRTILVLSRE
ncbi:Ff.00g129530.m01.CDS01 [Fusarium sp. VM40]|nr:Ff.00g129530.m01.CDS01 [Fusarium sp. VM40]